MSEAFREAWAAVISPFPSSPSILKPLRAPLGVYAVIGNHDRWEDAGSVTAAFGAVGIRVLENQNVTLATPRGPLHLAGIGDLYTKAHDPQQALAGLRGGCAGSLLHPYARPVSANCRPPAP